MFLLKAKYIVDIKDEIGINVIIIVVRYALRGLCNYAPRISTREIAKRRVARSVGLQYANG